MARRRKPQRRRLPDLTDDDPRLSVFVAEITEFSRTHPGATHMELQRHYDLVAKRLGVSAPRAASVETFAAPLGVPVEWPIAKIREFKRRAMSGAEIQWARVHMSGPRAGEREIFWEALPEDSRKRGGGRRRRMTLQEFKKFVEAHDRLKTAAERALFLKNAGVKISVSTARRLELERRRQTPSK